jgi:hypothetical protein
VAPRLQLGPEPGPEVGSEAGTVTSPSLGDEDEAFHPNGGAGLVFYPRTAVSYRSGDGSMPPGLAAAVDTMRVGEEATVWCEPSPELESGQGPRFESGLRLPPPPAAAAQDGVQYTARLISMVHVRDVFGDGGVFKRREREGTGEFPADCPIHDCRVRVHFTARLLPPPAEASGSSHSHSLEAASPASPGQPPNTGQPLGQPSDTGQSSGEPSDTGQSPGQPSDTGQSMDTTANQGVRSDTVVARGDGLAEV